jgi:hypothetical protein
VVLNKKMLNAKKMNSMSNFSSLDFFNKIIIEPANAKMMPGIVSYKEIIVIFNILLFLVISKSEIGGG